MAKKLFNRPKRYAPIRKGRHRKKRQKSFKTEAAAMKWAEAKGMKNITLKNSKNPEAKEKKFKVIQR